MWNPGRLASSICLAGLAGLALGLTACGSSGLADYRTLKQLYNVEKDGKLTHARAIESETFFSRTFGSVLRPFGYGRSYKSVDVGDPGRMSRETIRSLVDSFEGRPDLIALSLPQLSRIALQAPFDLTRAQATWAIGRALRDHLPDRRIEGEPVREDDPRVAVAIRTLFAGDATEASESTAPAPSEAQATASLEVLGRVAFSKDIAKARQAIRVVALYAASSVASANAREEAAIAIDAIGRSLSAMTLVRASGDKAATVRSEAARSFREANAIWAEAALLAMVDGETDAMTRRKVFRAIEVYRTSRVAKRMLAVLEDPQTSPTDRVCARRALTAFTRKDLGDDALAWRAALTKWL